ncbi:hypothetical protein CL630_02615 [bacterium]|nr:hypothetical protein [bacterium]|tara:strand:- start:13644 stop:14363 length:720 start_codon:yes stop_codon:yes gene_type:complete
MQAVILAGGLGTRLHPITETIPKPMVNISGRPFLEYIIELLKKNDITEILILTGHLGDAIEQYFGDGSEFGVNINYSKETKPLGVSGALCLAYPKLADSFLLLYGDNFILLNFKDLVRFYKQSKKQAAAVSYQYKDEKDRGDDYRYNLCVDEMGHVTQYQQRGVQGATHVEAGVMVLRKEVIANLPQKHSNALGEVLFPDLIQQKELITYVSKNRFYDIGTPERLKKAEAFFRAMEVKK